MEGLENVGYGRYSYSGIPKQVDDLLFSLSREKKMTPKRFKKNNEVEDTIQVYGELIDINTLNLKHTK